MSPAPRASIVIADGHPAFREGLRRLLESIAAFSVVGTAHDGSQAVAMVATHQPRVLMLDLHIRRCPGLDVLRAVEHHPQLCTVVLSSAVSTVEGLAALKLGARALILKDAGLDVLHRAVKAVLTDRYWIGRRSVRDRTAALREFGAFGAGSPPPFGVTSRELAVLSGVVAGLSNSEIARGLAVSAGTVKHRVTSLLTKTGAETRAELAVFAVHRGVVAADAPVPRIRAG